MRIAIAALLAWIATIGVAHAQLSVDQAGQKELRELIRASTVPGTEGVLHNKYTGEYHGIARADCEYLHSMDHAWSWRTESKL